MIDTALIIIFFFGFIVPVMFYFETNPSTRITAKYIIIYLLCLIVFTIGIIMVFILQLSNIQHFISK